MPRRTENASRWTASGRIALFLALAFGIAWLWAFAVVWPLHARAGSYDANAQLATVVCMFAPALAVLIVRLVTREGFADSWFKPRDFKRTLGYYLLGWLGTIALVAIGAAAWFLVNPQDFDPQMSAMVATYLEQAEQAGQADLVSESDVRPVLLTQLAAVPIAAIVNFVPCFGEEWGWRGYLLPKLLERHGVAWTLVASGLVWGIWHAPLTAIGHNYGVGYPGFPVTGILAMCCFTTVTGILLSYVTLRSGSCIPAILAHGSINGCGTMGLAFSTSGGNPFVGPAATGIIGGLGLVIAAVVLGVALVKNPPATVGEHAA